MSWSTRFSRVRGGQRHLQPAANHMPVSAFVAVGIPDVGFVMNTVKQSLESLSISGAAIRYAVIGFSWLVFVWDMYLSYRQYRVLQTTASVPSQLAGVIEKENFEKSKHYNKDKFKFAFVTGLWGQLLSTAILSLNVIPMLWDLSGRVVQSAGLGHGEVKQTLAFVVIGSLFSEILNLPFAIYSNFVIEERHGFNKYTPSFYAKDKVKKFVVGQSIMLPIVAAVIQIIRAGGQYFFFYLWVFLFFVTIALITIYPDFIAPLFDKFTLLPEGDLRTKIEELAASIHFPLKKLFVVEGSKRSTHSNAYFFGFYKNKRIVLFDTLIEGYVSAGATAKVADETDQQSKKTGCTTDEVVAVLAHELGHWKCNHIMKNLLISEVNLLCCLAVFGLLFKNETIFRAFGFTNQRPIFIGLVIIFQYIFSPYNEISGFLMTCLSRRFEFQADAFAKKLNKATDLRSGLIKLGKDNLSFPVYDRLYSMFNHSHPPLLERLDALGKVD